MGSKNTNYLRFSGKQKAEIWFYQNLPLKWNWGEENFALQPLERHCITTLTVGEILAKRNSGVDLPYKKIPPPLCPEQHPLLLFSQSTSLLLLCSSPLPVGTSVSLLVLTFPLSVSSSCTSLSLTSSHAPPLSSWRQTNTFQICKNQDHRCHQELDTSFQREGKAGAGGISTRTKMWRKSILGEKLFWQLLPLVQVERLGSAGKILFNNSIPCSTMVSCEGWSHLRKMSEWW